MALDILLGILDSADVETSDGMKVGGIVGFEDGPEVGTALRIEVGTTVVSRKDFIRIPYMTLRYL